MRIYKFMNGISNNEHWYLFFDGSSHLLRVVMYCRQLYIHQELLLWSPPNHCSFNPVRHTQHGATQYRRIMQSNYLLKEDVFVFNGIHISKVKCAKYIDRSVQRRRNSSTLAIKLRISCTDPCMDFYLYCLWPVFALSCFLSILSLTCFRIFMTHYTIT